MFKQFFVIEEQMGQGCDRGIGCGIRVSKCEMDDSYDLFNQWYHMVARASYTSTSQDVLENVARELVDDIYGRKRVIFVPADSAIEVKPEVVLKPILDQMEENKKNKIKEREIARLKELQEKCPDE